MARGNVSNLVPFNMRTEEEQKRIRTLGGIMSGESRRKKRDLKNAMENILYNDIKDPEELKHHIKKMKDYGFEAECVGDILVFTCMRKAMAGDLKAMEMVLNITGEGKANNSVTVNVDSSDKNQLTLEEIQRMKSDLLSMTKKKNFKNDTKRDRKKD